MTAGLLASNHSSLQSLQTCEAHKKQLIQEIELSNEELKNVSQVSKFTPEIKKRIAFLEQEIEDNKNKIVEVDKMLELAPGSWVRNGTTKPGKVIKLKISGRIPEVHVQWAGDTVAVPERPMQLKLLQPTDVEYIWNGDRLSKLVRRIDHHECDEIEVLTDNLKRLSKCKELATTEESIKDYSVRVAYCKKRITWVNQNDLEKLEHIVKQGLDIFYRVGEALAEIRDRALYKDLGYSDFREYLEKRWDMGKSKAYRLIDAANVVKNLSSAESVPNWGQNLPSAYETIEEALVLPIPKSEAITRELAKLPSDRQKLGWAEVVRTAPNSKPTAAHTKSVVAEIISGSSNKQLAEQFEIGQLVKLKLTHFEGASDSLKLANHSYGQITALTENKCNFNVKIFGRESYFVSPQDIQPVNLVKFHVDFSPQEYIALMSTYQTRDCLEDAIKKGVLGK